MISNATYSRHLPAVVLAIAIACSAQPALAQTDEDEEFTQTSKQLVQDDSDETRAVRLFNEAQEAHADGDLDKALELYHQALGLMPEFPEAEFQCGSIYESRGRLAEAEAAYRRALALRENWTLPMSALGGLLVGRGEFKEAERLLSRALEIDGNCIPCYPALTELYLRNNAPDSVLRTHLQKLTILTYKARIPAGVWAAKAAVERFVGEISAARESLKRGLAVDPSNTALNFENVELLLVEGDTEGAVSAARALVAADPDSAAAKVRLARALYSAGNSKEAISILETAADDEEAASALKAIRATASEDPGEIEKQLEKEPDSASLNGRLCTLLRIDDPSRALTYCLRASELEPANIGHAVGYAAALLQLRKYPEAAALLSRLKSVAPENYTVRANYATALFQLGRFEQALDEYVWITEQQPDLAAGYYFLAICHDKLGAYAPALAGYRRFLDLADPETFKLEIERVELRLPILQDQIKKGKG